MKNRELVEHLQALDPELEVYVGSELSLKTHPIVKVSKEPELNMCGPVYMDPVHVITLTVRPNLREVGNEKSR